MLYIIYFFFILFLPIDCIDEYTPQELAFNYIRNLDKIPSSKAHNLSDYKKVKKISDVAVFSRSSNAILEIIGGKEKIKSDTIKNQKYNDDINLITLLNSLRFEDNIIALTDNFIENYNDEYYIGRADGKDGYSQKFTIFLERLVSDKERKKEIKISKKRKYFENELRRLFREVMARESLPFINREFNKKIVSGRRFLINHFVENPVDANKFVKYYYHEMRIDARRFRSKYSWFDKDYLRLNPLFQFLKGSSPLVPVLLTIPNIYLLIKNAAVFPRLGNYIKSAFTDKKISFKDAVKGHSSAAWLFLTGGAFFKYFKHFNQYVMELKSELRKRYTIALEIQKDIERKLNQNAGTPEYELFKKINIHIENFLNQESAASVKDFFSFLKSLVADKSFTTGVMNTFKPVLFCQVVDQFMDSVVLAHAKADALKNSIDENPYCISEDSDKNIKLINAWQDRIYDPVFSTLDVKKDIIISGPNSAGKTIILEELLLAPFYNNLGIAPAEKAVVPFVERVFSTLHVDDTYIDSSRVPGEVQFFQDIHQLCNEDKVSKKIMIGADEVLFKQQEKMAVDFFEKDAAWALDDARINFFFSTHFSSLFRKYENKAKPYFMEVLISEESGGIIKNLLKTILNKEKIMTPVVKYTYKLIEGGSDHKDNWWVNLTEDQKRIFNDYFINSAKEITIKHIENVKKRITDNVNQIERAITRSLKKG